MKHRLYLPTFLPVSFPDVTETFLAEMSLSPDWIQTPYDPIAIVSENSDSNYVRSRTNFLGPVTF